MYARTVLSHLCTIASRNAIPHPVRLSCFTDRLSALRCFCKKIPDEPSSQIDDTYKKDPHDLSGNIGGYKKFKDQDAPIILDIEEERFLKQVQTVDEEDDEFDCLSPSRGDRGVFSPEELVNVLHKQKAKDIMVVAIPDSLNYVDQMVFVTAKSHKHAYGIAEFVRRAFKRKCTVYDRIPKLEGSKKCDWIALDLGNIALHIFSKESRKLYDLEDLWVVGPEYDSHLNHPEDSISAVLRSHSVHLDDLQPDSVNVKSG